VQLLGAARQQVSLLLCPSLEVCPSSDRSIGPRSGWDIAPSGPRRVAPSLASLPGDGRLRQLAAANRME
jgi:hypothetical protein